MKHIVVMGNPIDGFRFIGPFEDVETAVKYLDGELSNEDCWTAELDAPADF